MKTLEQYVLDHELKMQESDGDQKSDHEKLMEVYERLNQKVDETLERIRVRRERKEKKC